MKISEQEMFERIEIALKAYYEEMGISGQIQVEVFVDWMYNKYGRLRGKGENEKMDRVQRLDP
jgi:hypothetical protein